MNKQVRQKKNKHTNKSNQMYLETVEGETPIASAISLRV